MIDVARRKLIIQEIASGRTDKLGDLLLDTKLYDYSTKDVFISRLSHFFLLIREKDTYSLIPYEGVCSNADCLHEGCSGVAFVASIYGYRFDLIFCDEDDEHEIVQCPNGIRTFDFIPGNTFKFKIPIEPNQRYDYFPGLEMLVRAEECSEALRELESLPIKTVKPEVLRDWVQKHSGIYSGPSGYTGCWEFDNFMREYESVSKFITLLFYKKDVLTQALSDFDLLKGGEEQIQWLEKYFDELGSFHHYMGDSQVFEVEEFNVISSDYPVFLDFYQKLKHLVKLHNKRIPRNYRFSTLFWGDSDVSIFDELPF